jgi:aspartate aminotransferase
MYFHPPLWGAQLAHMVLSDAKLYPSWLAELRAMADRLRSVREKLFDMITNKLKTPGDWSHIKLATGMYCTLLLPSGQVEALTSKRQVHLLPEGCVALGCLDAPKIEVLSRAVDFVVREGIREAEEQQAEEMAMQLAIAAAKEQEARQEAEARAAAEEAAAAAAQAEDTLLMEASIQSAMEAQRVAEEEERRREDEALLLEEQVRKAAERAEIARQADLILASIG